MQTCQEHFARTVQPVFPSEALRDGLSGYVVVTYDLDGSGKAQNVQVVVAHPAGVFNAVAMEALRRSEFKQGVSVSGCRYVADFAVVRR